MMRVHGKNHILGSINSLLKRLEDHHLTVTRRAAGKLVSFRDKLSKASPGHRLTSGEAKQLSKLVQELRHTLSAEAGANVAFVVADKRLNVDKLLKDMPALFAGGVFAALPDLAQYDFREAGKCIAFELPTAGAFHLLRATEGVLKHFHYCVTGKDVVEGSTWGQTINALRAGQHALPGPLLNNLDNIREHYRNPTQHPQKRYDSDEVQDLFGLCVDAVGQMVKSRLWVKAVS